MCTQFGEIYGCADDLRLLKIWVLFLSFKTRLQVLRGTLGKHVKQQHSKLHVR